MTAVASRERSVPALGFGPIALALCACISVGGSKPEPVALYALDATFEEGAATGPGPVLVVGAPRAAPGFDAVRMVYVRRAHERQFFARSQWVDTPARMVAPLLVRAIERTGRFQAVTEAPSPVVAGLRLETEIVRIQHEFTASPSRVRFTMRAQLVDLATSRVLGTREFDAVEDAPSADPYGGVLAANRAVERVLRETADYCAAHAGSEAAPIR